MRTVSRSVLVRMTLLSVGVSVSGIGCASDTTGPAPLDPAHAYWQLTLNHHAITLALTPPYDTLQLVATLSSATGTPLADSGVTTWTTSDTSVQVSPRGLLTAIAPATGVMLKVRHTIGKVTNSDLAVVNVNDIAPVPRFATLTLQQNAAPSDTVYQNIYGLRTFATSALDPNGDTIPNVVISVTATPAFLGQVTGDQFVEGGETGFFRGTSAGHALMVAEATVYGVRRVDTLPVTIGWWHHTLVAVRPYTSAGNRTPIGTFVPQEDTVAVGGTVAWQNQLSNQPIDVVFDDSTAVQAVDSATFLDGVAANFNLVIPTQGGGNIPAFAPLDTGALRGEDGVGVRARRFPVAGTYRYHSALYGTTGVIQVLPEFQVP